VRPIVLDFDGAVAPLPGELRVPLRQWQKPLRRSCRARTLARFRADLDRVLPATDGVVFIGSGQFHHVTLELVRRWYAQGPFRVVVFDNHPDNVRCPRRIHCGSWVRRVASLPIVRSVHVVGITSPAASFAHVWGNYLTPLVLGKLTYWCIGPNTGWARWLGLGGRVRGFRSARAMIDEFLDEQGYGRSPVYLSIDKDVLSLGAAQPKAAHGALNVDDLLEAITPLRDRLVGCDVTGDRSTGRGDSEQQQRDINLRILAGLQSALAVS
jgi:hypothetical protein